MSCQLCGATTQLQEHHTSYNPPEKITICRPCHQKQHNGHGVGLVKGDSTFFLSCGDAATEQMDWTCPKCGKLITSLYPRQLAQNRSQHEMSCVQKDEANKQ